MKTYWKTNVASVVVCSMPIFYYCYVLIFWLLASLALGHWAQPNVNDPKGFLYGIPVIIGIILMLLSWAVAPVVVYLGLKRRKALIHVVAYIVSLSLSIMLFRIDLFKITSWIAD